LFGQQITQGGAVTTLLPLFALVPKTWFVHNDRRILL